MELIRGIHNLTVSHRPSVVSIGNFDGVHLGHQHVISSLLEQSRIRQAPSTVVTFEPLAKEFFSPDLVVRLSTIDEKAKLLFDLGVDRVLCIDFTAEFASYSPDQFIQEVLIEGLGAEYLSVGDDFKFGKARAGDFAMLQKVGSSKGFAVSAHDTFEIYGQRVSSGRVRQALLAGDFALAENLLGRAYTISGPVSKGEQQGRTIGYPTANIVLPDVRLAVHGVYATKVRVNSVELNGVANVGRRPTVNGQQNRLEVHLFDFDDDIYGETLQVRFVEKIRDEQKYASFGALKKQIQLDAQQAQAIFADILPTSDL